MTDGEMMDRLLKPFRLAHSFVALTSWACLALLAVVGFMAMLVMFMIWLIAVTTLVAAGFILIVLVFIITPRKLREWIAEKVDGEE